MIRDQVAALWSIFAFFGVPSGKTVFCPSWITYSSLVILDFAVRHGLLRADDPEYLDVATGLHRPLD